ncbi:MAG: cyclase [Lachnospiraceae bacterium]|jgi:kynurenine formamidase|nr:cyclase [Lachnospiraceae bacterium]MCI8995271.1 cyclase [Lachnospiraceae bacterium]MCI9133563.1 cyclase [Lachnospiraceae bacterium]
MLIDITLRITPKMVEDAQGNEKKAMVGHLGTHFDVMNQEFPLEYITRRGVVFDVSAWKEREITSADVELERVSPDMAVLFYTGFVEQEGYGGKRYFTEHPQLSRELVEKLVERKVSIIGVDFAGVRRGKEHTPTDQYCADQGVFIVENLCNLGSLPADGEEFLVHTYPMNYEGMTGLPCRVVAEKP